MDTSHLDAMLTLSQAARAVNVSRQLVYRWRERGLLDTDEHGKVSYESVLDVEERTRNCAQPGAWQRARKPVAV